MIDRTKADGVRILDKKQPVGLRGTNSKNLKIREVARIFSGFPRPLISILECFKIGFYVRTGAINRKIGKFSHFPSSLDGNSLF